MSSDHPILGDWAPHRRSWRRWKVTDRFTRWCYLLGLARSGMLCMDSTCTWNGARRRDFRWGRRPYVLGWPTEKWRCLLRYRHWPHWPGGSPVFMGACGRCLRWSCCNSIETGHAATCPDYTTDGWPRCTAVWWDMTADPFTQRRCGRPVPDDGGCECAEHQRQAEWAARQQIARTVAG